MAITPLKSFLFAAGGSVVVAGTAYVSGALDPYIKSPPAEAVSLTSPATETAPAKTGTEGRVPAAAKGADAADPAGGAMASKAPAASGTDAMAPAGSDPSTKPATLPAPAGVIAPTFDVVRVEGNGSIVIAGKAAPKAKVEIVHGSAVLGETVADAEGAFAIVLDDPLKPGDYQIVLRSTAPGNVVATSTQTAVIAVPDKSDGQVLALVEEPGKPSELITVPEPENQPEKKPGAPASTGEGAAQKSAEPSVAGTPDAAAPAPAEQPSASASTETPPAPAASAKSVVPATGPKVVVEAVEIDGGRIFVAGLADPGRRVRAYANDILLGDAKTSPDGHFLVEATRDIPVGDYIIHADALGEDGKVVARAVVPFQREPGDTISAVAPSEAKPAPAGEVANPEKPASSAPEQSSAAATPPAGVAETVAPKLEHADGAVIIRRGDSLWRISRRVYGHGIRYSTIYLANQEQISDPDRIWPGQVFKVPEKSKEGETADLKAMGDQVTTAQ